MKHRRLTLLLAVPPLAFLSMAAAIGFVIDAPHLLLLQRQHAETVGRVTRLPPDSHGAIEFSYSVRGATYTRITQPYGLALPVAVGDPVPVDYYPPDPAVAFTAPADDILAGELPSWIVGSLLGCVFGVGIVFSLTTGAMGTARATTVGPKVMSVGITIGVFVGCTTSLLARPFRAGMIVGGILALSACALFLRLAWWRKLTWGGLVRSGGFWIAFGLGVAANVVDMLL